MRFRREIEALSEILAGWGIGLPRGSEPELGKWLLKIRGEVLLPVKELAGEMKKSEWFLYQLHQYAQRRGDSPFRNGLASRNGVENWLSTHPEFKARWRRHKSPQSQELAE